MAQRKVTKVAPLRGKEKEEWNAIVQRSKEIYFGVEKDILELCLIAGQIQTKYGDDRFGTWIEEVGLSRSQAYKYRQVAKAGLNQKFIEEKGHIGFSKLYVIAKYAGKFSGEDAKIWLDKAEHLTRDDLENALLDRIKISDSQRQREQEERQREISAMREALSEKGKINAVRLLEEADDAYAAAEFLSDENYRDLINAAGPEQFEDLVRQFTKWNQEDYTSRSKSDLRTLEKYVVWMKNNAKRVAESIESGHFSSGDLFAAVRALKVAMIPLIEVQAPGDPFADIIDMKELLADAITMRDDMGNSLNRTEDIVDAEIVDQ